MQSNILQPIFDIVTKYHNTKITNNKQVIGELVGLLTDILHFKQQVNGPLLDDKQFALYRLQHNNQVHHWVALVYNNIHTIDILDKDCYGMAQFDDETNMIDDYVFRHIGTSNPLDNFIVARCEGVDDYGVKIYGT